ncbi:MAG TPA: hypothetical protein VIP70_12215 [Nitrososphaeraceae archaeon]
MFKNEFTTDCGFGCDREGKGQQQPPPTPFVNMHLTDKDDLEEISNIREMLNLDESVLLVAKQARIITGTDAAVAIECADSYYHLLASLNTYL